MLAGIFAAVLDAGLSFNGGFTTTGASAPVTSSTRTALGPGTLLFNDLSESSDAEYSKNGGAFIDITDGLTLAMALGDTLVVRDRTITAETQTVFSLRNNATSALIESVVLTRT